MDEENEPSDMQTPMTATTSSSHISVNGMVAIDGHTYSLRSHSLACIYLGRCKSLDLSVVNQAVGMKEGKEHTVSYSYTYVN